VAIGGPFIPLGDTAPRGARRKYSTTFTALRRARMEFARRRRFANGVPLDAFGRPEDEGQVVVLANWIYQGSGYRTTGERWLALSAAARAREWKQAAREALQELGDRDIDWMTA
jgi:hypothetical protein